MIRQKKITKRLVIRYDEEITEIKKDHRKIITEEIPKSIEFFENYKEISGDMFGYYLFNEKDEIDVDDMVLDGLPGFHLGFNLEINVPREYIKSESNINEFISGFADKYRDQMTISDYDPISGIDYASLVIQTELMSRLFSKVCKFETDLYIYEVTRTLDDDILTYVFNVYAQDKSYDVDPLDFQ